MKTIKNILALTLFISIFSSCMDKYTESFIANSPVYLSYEDLRESIKLTDSRELKNTGKIYFKDGYIFINEELKGIHIIDNQDPSNPNNIGFITIPGNVDIAIKDDILYADSFVDLVVIDISDINNPKEVNRVEDVFPYTTPMPTEDDYPVAKVDEEKGVVIEWEVKKIKQEMEYRYYPVYYNLESSKMFDGADGITNGGAPQSGSSFGIGGSMARFGLYNDYLYAVDNARLYMFDVSSPETPTDIGEQQIGWQIETMFIYDDHMFFGTQNGMLIFSLEVPTLPNYIDEFRHITSCDPVVISEGYAYITLRGGTQCGSNVNRLDVLKLSENYVGNQLLASYPLHGPYGLGIDDETLFVCDGDAGLKIYNVSDKLLIDENQIASFPNIKTYDVIPFENHLFMIAESGFYQYDYSDLENIKQISFIPVIEDN